MNNKESVWENLPVQGDVNELNAIINTPSLISLDRNDIMKVLNAEGDSFIITGTAGSLIEALHSALEKMPLVYIEDMAVAIWCGASQFPMSGTSVKNALSELDSEINKPDKNISWGIFTDSSLDDSFKVTIIATGLDRASRAKRRRQIAEENGRKYKSVYEDYMAKLRKETLELMRRRHAYYTKLIDEAKVKTAKDFYDKFKEHFEMYGVDLTLSDDKSCCSIYLELGDYDYEQYWVINSKNGNLAEVSPEVAFKEMFHNVEVNIFTEEEI